MIKFNLNSRLPIESPRDSNHFWTDKVGSKCRLRPPRIKLSPHRLIEENRLQELAEPLN